MVVDNTGHNVTVIQRIEHSCHYEDCHCISAQKTSKLFTAWASFFFYNTSSLIIALQIHCMIKSQQDRW